MNEIAISHEVLKQPDGLDQCEAMIAQLPPAVMPLTHRFTPHLYTREILIPKGTVLTSRIHKTEHPFFIMKGDITVYSDNESTVRYIAPYIGVTTPGTRRLLYANEDTVWVTCHVTDNLDPDEIGEEITEAPDNFLFENQDDPRINTWRSSVSPSTIAHMTPALTE